MKALLTTLVLASTPVIAQQAAPEPTLKAGSEVKLEAVSAATWVQGEPLKEWEPGKVYMFECWATWCGPCIAAIPHVNDLHKKYHAKGLRVYGMNVWEDGLEKVEKFVKDKGDGMSYPIAYTGKGSAFEKEWLTAAGVRGIPHAFIVKDGKLAVTSHPAQLTDAVIELLLSGDEGVKKAVAAIEDAKKAREGSTSVMTEFRKAAAAGDSETMAAKIAEMEKLQPDSPQLPTMKLDLLIAKKDWAAAGKAIEELPDGSTRQMSLMMTASRVAMRDDASFPVDFVKTVAKAYAAMMEESKASSNASGLIMLSILHAKAGDKDAAIASAKNALDSARKTAAGRSMPIAPFESFVKATEEGKNPTMKDFSGWMQEAMKAGAEAVPAGAVQPRE